MSDHEHHAYATRKELDGFGTRLNEAEKDLEGNSVKTDRNAADVQDLFKLVGENAKTVGTLEKSLAGLTGKIAGIVAVISFLVPFLVKLGERFIGK